MESYKAHRERFIERWGELAVGWGVNKTMGQIQALLLIETQPICCQAMREELDLSAGSVNKATRTLIDWGLIHKVPVDGERKDYYVAEKDVFQMFKAVIENRMKKELDPMIALLEDMDDVEAQCDNSKEFLTMMQKMLHFSYATKESLNKLSTTQPKWLFNSYGKKSKI